MLSGILSIKRQKKTFEKLTITVFLLKMKIWKKIELIFLDIDFQRTPLAYRHFNKFQRFDVIRKLSCLSYALMRIFNFFPAREKSSLMHQSK